MALLPLVLTPEAALDIDQAVTYYESVSSGLGTEFITVIDKYFSQIQTVPTASAVQYDEIRVKPVSVFPFTIHYFIQENQILIIRVFNTHKKQLFK